MTRPSAVIEGMPMGIPDDLDFDFINAFVAKQRILHTPTNAFVHRTTWRRESHRDGDLCTVNGDVVYQSQVNDVAANLRVNDLTQSFENRGFAGRGGGQHGWDEFVYLWQPKFFDRSCSRSARENGFCRRNTGGDKLKFRHRRFCEFRFC